MQNDTKCEKHSQEIIEIRTEFHEYKKSTNRILKEILEKIKPQFTHAQITGFLISLVFAMAGAMIYITDVKSDGRVNKVQIDNTIEQYKLINEKLDRLIENK